MASLSLLLGILSLIGYALFFWHAGPPVLFFSALILGIAAAILGFMRRSQKAGMQGLIIGIVCIAIGIALFLWLHISSGSVTPTT